MAKRLLLDSDEQIRSNPQNKRLRGLSNLLKGLAHNFLPMPEMLASHRS